MFTNSEMIMKGEKNEWYSKYGFQTGVLVFLLILSLKRSDHHRPATATQNFSNPITLFVVFITIATTTKTAHWSVFCKSMG